MSEGKSLHIVPATSGWAVKEEGQSTPSSTHRTQSEAARVATEILQDRDGGGEVLIHGTDGRIRERNTINRKDPFPPRG